MTDRPYETGFLDEIVNVHFNSVANYIYFRASGVLTHTGSLDPPAAITCTLSLRNGSSRTYLKITQSTSSATAETWYSFASPSGQSNFADGGPFGYATVAAFEAAWNANVFTAIGMKAQGRPPDSTFPGATTPMTPHAEAVAHAAFVNGAAAGTLITGTGNVFALCHAPATWIADKTIAQEGVRNFSVDVIVGFSDPGLIFDVMLTGTDGGDPPLVASGGSASVYRDVKLKPAQINPISIQAQGFADWTTISDGPVTSGAFTVVLDTNGSLTGTPGSFYISSPGFHD